MGWPTINFSPKITGLTLFDYVDHVYRSYAWADPYLYIKTKLKPLTRLTDWNVIKFSPRKKVLRIEMVNPEREEHGNVVLHPLKHEMPERIKLTILRKYYWMAKKGSPLEEIQNEITQEIIRIERG